MRGNFSKELSQAIVNPVNNKIQENNEVSNLLQDFLSLCYHISKIYCTFKPNTSWVAFIKEYL